MAPEQGSAAIREVNHDLAPPALNPAQQKVVDLLGAKKTERPTFADDLGDRLRERLEDDLRDVAATLEEPLNVSKHILSQVHGCEDRFLAERAEPFTPNVAVARGTVAHKAIELSIHWRGEPAPLELVDRAMSRLSMTDHWLTDYLLTCDDAERAEVRSEAGQRVAAFMETWPPLNARWRPVTESGSRVELCGQKIVFRGKTDLTLGAADGNVAGKVIVDFKTGGTAVSHLDDLRFYALLETIKLGVPPRLLASYYLEQGVFQPEKVTEGLLDAAAARTVDGVHRIAELLSRSRQPVRRAGPSCRWCPLLADCEQGTAELARLDDW